MRRAGESGNLCNIPVPKGTGLYAPDPRHAELLPVDVQVLRRGIRPRHVCIQHTYNIADHPCPLRIDTSGSQNVGHATIAIVFDYDFEVDCLIAKPHCLGL